EPAPEPVVLTGTPPGHATANEPYSFTPSVSAADGANLSFSIVNRPGWATFDSATGTLSGTPAASDAGVHGGIRIRVTDGDSEDTLGPFEITVNDGELRTVTLSWQAPTELADGTPLTDLAGFRIYYGRIAGDYEEVVELDNPGLSTYVVEGLSGGTTWYFSATAFRANGLESEFSGEVAYFVD
ncbi:MAG: hypothetical protein EA371_07485, partial [Gammaproteobacteria bacterium]